MDGAFSAEAFEDALRMDVQVNKTERFLRRRLVIHLTIQPGVGAADCLVFASAARHAERIGDYCKDILEAVKLLEGREEESRPIRHQLRSLFETTGGILERTSTALEARDSDAARQIVVEERDVEPHSRELVKRLMAEGVSCIGCAPLVLIISYLERIAAHASGIASGLIMPVHKIDYFDVKWLNPTGRCRLDSGP